MKIQCSHGADRGRLGHDSIEKVLSARTLMQMIVVLTATVAMKALSVHYDFSWATALAAG